jgi:hypothetical protein
MDDSDIRKTGEREKSYSIKIHHVNIGLRIRWVSARPADQVKICMASENAVLHNLVESSMCGTGFSIAEVGGAFLGLSHGKYWISPSR